MPAHHKTSDSGVGRGQILSTEMRGDASFRPYFVDDAAWAEAMSRAAWLESRNMPRRAWRVRLNVDGVQPNYAPAPVDLDEPDDALETVETIKEQRLKKNRLKALQRRVKKLKKELEDE
jgi:hypothetical protein